MKEAPAPPLKISEATPNFIFLADYGSLNEWYELYRGNFFCFWELFYASLNEAIDWFNYDWRSKLFYLLFFFIKTAEDFRRYLAGSSLRAERDLEFDFLT